MKNLVSLLITALCRANRTAAQAFAAANDDGRSIYYRVTSTTAPWTVEVTSNPGEHTGHVAIPASVIYEDTTYAVTKIGEGAFHRCTGITSVTIPHSVTEIGEGAFYGCTGLTSVTIPHSVMEMGDSVFDNCTGLTAINVEAGNRHYCSSDGVLFNKDKTILVACPGGKTGGYIIPHSVTEIDWGAFSACAGITSVIIPHSVTKIGRGAFLNCSGIPSVIIPPSVTEIGEGAFSGCSGITSVAIPHAVTEIGMHVFYNCSGLPSVTIPHAVTKIGRGAFYGCTGLPSITIPHAVTSIGHYAFCDCSGLLSITIHAARPPRCGEGAFDGVSKSIPVYVPCGSLASYKKSEWWSGYFTNMMEDCGWGSAAGTFAQYARAQETEETMVRG